MGGTKVSAAAGARTGKRVSVTGLEHWVLPIIIVVLLAVIWGGTLALADVERSDAQHAAQMSTRELLGTYEAQVVRALHETDDALRLVKYAYERGHRVPLDELARRALLPPDILFTVSIADREGRIIASTGTAGDSVATADFFKSARDTPTDSVTMERLAPGPTANRKLRFALRLNEADGSFSGIALVAVDAAYFVSGYESSKLGAHGLVALAGDDGVVTVRRSGDSLFSGERIDYSRLIPNLRDRDDDEDIDVPVVLSAGSWDGVRRYVAGRALYGHPLAVVVGLSEAEQLAGAVRKTRVFLQRATLGSVLVVGLGGLLWRMSWQLAQSRQREVQSRVAHAEQVEHLAYHDSLTGLPNRSLFSRLLAQMIAQAQRNGTQLAVAFLDLDRFKHINDTLGHEAGDQLLQEVARRLESCVRASDTVARLGGDEFVVLLPELAGTQDAAAVARKILAALASPYTLIGQEFRVTASIGISTYPSGGLDEQTLTKTADIAMYHAKEGGKNNFQFFSEELNANSLERVALETGLRHALERGELELHYQAKRDMLTGHITGMEALVRWRHRDMGLLAPLRFLHIAEETGLIIPIGRWILERACQQNVAWRQAGLPPLIMAVNINGRQFTDERLLEDVETALRASGLEPQFLELEIAESVLIRDTTRSVGILSRLKAMGVRLAVDGFGTGYATLALLKQFPLDTLKIDRSFVRGATRGGTNELLADALIALGRALSLTVVAQGVETRSQVDFLRSHACDELQGFYFNEPLPAEQAAQLVAARAAWDFGGSGERIQSGAGT